MDMNVKIPVPQGSTGEVLHGKREKREVRSSISLLVKRTGGKKVVYDGYAKAASAKVWEILECDFHKRAYHSPPFIFH